MFDKWYVMRKLIDSEKRFHNSYVDVGDRSFYERKNQFRLIRICETLVTEDGLAEWENGSSISLRLKVTEFGKGYFKRIRDRWRDRIGGFVFGIASTLAAQLLLRFLTEGW